MSECNENREVYVRQSPGFRVEAGTSSAKNGEIDVAVSTDLGQGIIIYKNGNSDFVVNGTSKEVVGYDLKGEPGKTPPAKIIDAVNGDIILRAKNGTIYLEAANIRITGVDGIGGEITIQGSKIVNIDAPTFNAQSTNATITGTQSSSVVGGYVQTVSDSKTTDVSGADLVNTSVTSQIFSGIIDRFNKFFSSVCSDGSQK